MQIPLILFWLSFSIPVFSQYWIAGDTSDYQVNSTEYILIPSSKVEFDLDCDQKVDVTLQSQGPVDQVNPWERLSFYMDDSVEVYNNNTGFISNFQSGDTVILTPDSLWTPHLDFIYGTGEAGPYGQYEIRERYILFRKNNKKDIQYAFILFSNQGIAFTIHKIISRCAQNPIHIITNKSKNDWIPALQVFPNPTMGLIHLSNSPDEVFIYNALGDQIRHEVSNSSILNVQNLVPGLYWLIVKSSQGVSCHPIIKQ